MKNHEQPNPIPDRLIGIQHSTNQSDYEKAAEINRRNLAGQYEAEPLPVNVVELPLERLSQRAKSPFEADGDVIRTVFLPRPDLKSARNQIIELTKKTHEDADKERVLQAELPEMLDQLDNDK